jgi:hypothetical protein
MQTFFGEVGELLEKARGGSVKEKQRPRAERLAEAAAALAGEVVAHQAAEGARQDLVAMVLERAAGGQATKTKDVKYPLVAMVRQALRRQGVRV